MTFATWQLGNSIFTKIHFSAGYANTSLLGPFPRCDTVTLQKVNMMSAKNVRAAWLLILQPSSSFDDDLRIDGSAHTSTTFFNRPTISILGTNPFSTAAAPNIFLHTPLFILFVSCTSLWGFCKVSSTNSFHTLLWFFNFPRNKQHPYEEASQLSSSRFYDFRGAKIPTAHCERALFKAEINICSQWSPSAKWRTSKKPCKNLYKPELTLIEAITFQDICIRVSNSNKRHWIIS